MQVNKLRERLAHIRCFLLDMDGTFYLGDHILPGSLDFLSAVQASGREAVFLTNNSAKSAQMYAEKLQCMGVREPFLRVITSGQVAARYALQHFPGKKAFVLGNPALTQELSKMGVAMDKKNPDYVLIGYDTTLDYAKMTAVCDFVRAGLPYIATHPDYNCPTAEGFAPDIGAIIAFIAASTGRQPDVILGKPYPAIVAEALRVTGCDVTELAMVGDRLYTDIAMGKSAGMTSILVLSGEASREDLQHSDVQPDFVLARLSDMVDLLPVSKG